MTGVQTCALPICSGIEVRYPFGHGLSYTRFDYSDLDYQGDQVTFCVTNMGQYHGMEIAQVYVSPPDGVETENSLYRPRIELKAFAKVGLEPGESKRVTLKLDARNFAIWNKGWQVPAGRYTIRVGSSSENLPLCCMVEKTALFLPVPGRGSVEAAVKAVPLDLRHSADAADGAARDLKAKSLPDWYVHPHGHPSHKDWERMLGRPVTSRPLHKGQFTMEHSVLEMKDHSLVMRIFYRVIDRKSTRLSSSHSWIAFAGLWG